MHGTGREMHGSGRNSFVAQRWSNQQQHITHNLQKAKQALGLFFLDQCSESQYLMARI
jgi:hypothetical protein